MSILQQSNKENHIDAKARKKPFSQSSVNKEQQILNFKLKKIDLFLEKMFQIRNIVRRIIFL